MSDDLRSWLFPVAVATGNLDPADEDDRSELVALDHPELAEAIETAGTRSPSTGSR